MLWKGFGYQYALPKVSSAWLNIGELPIVAREHDVRVYLNGCGALLFEGTVGVQEKTKTRCPSLFV